MYFKYVFLIHNYREIHNYKGNKALNRLLVIRIVDLRLIELSAIS